MKDAAMEKQGPAVRTMDKLSEIILGPAAAQAAPKQQRGTAVKRFMDRVADAILRPKVGTPGSATLPAGASPREASSAPAPSLRAMRAELVEELTALMPMHAFVQRTSDQLRQSSLDRVLRVEDTRSSSTADRLVLLRAILDEFQRRGRIVSRRTCILCGGCCWPMGFDEQLALRGKRHLTRILQEIDDLGRLHALSPEGVAYAEFWTAPWPVHVLRADEPTSLAGKEGAWTGASVRLPVDAVAQYCAYARQVIECF